ncbi:MAG: DUF1501 domain-containing protein [Burkholderiales bacterium]|nr:DUF1501 domain-containing protein [Burkholderiales bacterium]
MKYPTRHDRRQFLKQATALALAGGLPTLDALTRVAHAAGDPGPTEVGADYKAIVCLFLFGGQDNANVLIPYRDGDGSGITEYTRYRQARANGSDPQNQSTSSGDLSYTNAQIAATALNISTGSDPGVSNVFTTHTYGRQFALHPSYSELRALYNGGKLAVVANVGPLIAPVNRLQWYGPSASRPPTPVNLYSHDDQQRAWMSGTADVANPTTGIGGRIAANPSIAAMNTGARISTQISIDGINPFMLSDPSAASTAVAYQVGSGNIGRLQTASTTPPATPTVCNTGTSFMNANPGSPYCIAGGPVRVNSGFSWNTALNGAFRSRINGVAEGVSIYHDQWRQTMNQSIQTEIDISAAFLNSPPSEDIVAPFQNAVASGLSVSGGSLGAQLRMVAAIIRASNQLGASTASPVKRQIFFVGIGGFDTHGSEFWNNNPQNNRQISLAVNAFWSALGNVRIRDAAGTGYLPGSAQDRVTLVTMSEFGRTLNSNGNGSDHGWGSYSLVLGGAVQGGKIYGMNHNVSAATAGSSVWMSPDLNCGAVPRVGMPPDRYNGSLTAPGARCNGLNHALDRGELLATTSGDAVLATIANWFGVPLGTAAQVDAMFPTLRAAHPGGWNVGFMT